MGLGKTSWSKCSRPRRKAQHLKCDASKFLQLFPVLAFWVVAYGIAGTVARHADDLFLAFRDLHDHVFLRGSGDCTAEQLDGLVRAFLSIVERAGWKANMRPKFHWLVHLPWGIILSALICEAKHRIHKRYARAQCNLVGFDKGVLSNTIADHFADLADDNRMRVDARLNAPTRQSKRLAALCNTHFGDHACVAARTARLQNRGMIATGDVALLSTRGISGACPHLNVCAGEVWAICSVSAKPVTLVSLWVHLIGGTVAGPLCQVAL
jgi:hypothetical protein